MPGKPPGPLVIAITAALESEGEATMAELCAILGFHRFDCSSVVSRMRKPTKMLPKRIYVARWTREDDSGGRPYLRAVLALGDLPDAPRPRPQPNSMSTAAYRAKMRNKVSSVFMWTQPQRVRLPVGRKIRELTGA